MKKTNLSWVGALLVFALLLWCTAATPGKIDDPSTYTCAVYSSALSLLPPVIAIVLALNTKEVYTSLLVGIATGALLFANGNLELAVTTLFFNEDGGMVAKLSDSSNVGILVFLVMLGILVALMNKAGGSAAFGRWASTHIHTRAGAQFATLLLGILIFVDDYFNCLTVGSVMRPVTDRHQISRPKLAYLIDATAAPVCMIAPISSWAAAVSSTAEDLDTGISGIQLFIRAIPYNFYSLLTFVFIITLTLLKFDYGPMRGFEERARNTGDLSGSAGSTEENANPKGRVIDLLAENADIVARYQGGNNAGHTVVTEKGKFILNLLPSGILHPEVTCVLGTGMVIDLEHLAGEMEAIEARGVKVEPENLKLSDKATISMPWHKVQDGLEEDRLAKKGGAFGSTRRGIAYAYSDKYRKKTLRLGDLLHLDEERTQNRLHMILDAKNMELAGCYHQEPMSYDALLNWCRQQAAYFAPFICDVGAFLQQAHDSGKRIVLEAQLGAMRDIDYGIFPFTSSSNTLAAYAPLGAGIPNCKLDHVVGVLKAYSTCVGAGPFAAENAMGEAWN